MLTFPREIIRSMDENHVMTTCMPLEFDGAEWESVVFFELGGEECGTDREVLQTASGALPVILEGDIIECASAAVVMLRFEIMTDPADPLAGEVLLTPGAGSTQFDTLELLTRQPTLRFYFSDANYQVIHSQQLVLGEQEHQGYRAMLDDAVSHDALIRLSGRYDAAAAMAEVTAQYATRLARVS